MAQVELKTELRDSDVLQILKELGGSATRASIKQLALQRFTPESVARDLSRRLIQLGKWKQIESGGYLKKGEIFYSIIEQQVKSPEQIALEEEQVEKNVIKFNRRNMLPDTRQVCPFCLERVSRFDQFVSIPRRIGERRFRVYAHKKCYDAGLCASGR